MTFGKKLSTLRKENNYTQEQLADLLSVSRQSVSKWESNISYPETEKLLRLSTLFHISIDSLLKDTETMPAHEMDSQQKSIDYSDFIGNWCNIDLKNWDSGYYMVSIIGQDENCLFFYYAEKKKHLKYGIVLKRHIDVVTKLEMNKRRQRFLPIVPETASLIGDPYKPLIGKECDIQMHSPDISTFILSTDGYQKVMVTSIDDRSIRIEDHGTAVILNKKDVVGIVES